MLNKYYKFIQPKFFLKFYNISRYLIILYLCLLSFSLFLCQLLARHITLLFERVFIVRI